MAAELKIVRTPAETALTEAWGAARNALPGAGKVAELRARAFDVFKAGGLPHRRVEAYKYTDLRALIREAKPLAAAPAKAALDAAAAIIAGLPDFGGPRAVLVNGFFAESLSRLDKVAGLRVRSLADALAAEGDAILSRLSGIADDKVDPQLALNAAFMRDGVVIEVADGAELAQPVTILAISTEAVTIVSRSLVVIGNGAKATIVEQHAGVDGIAYQANHAVELTVGDKAELKHFKVQVEGDQALHLATLSAVIGANVDIQTTAVTVGAGIARQQFFVTLNGEDSKLAIRNAAMLRTRQHSDNTLVVDHVAPGSESREVFKTVLDDESKGVFQGRIMVKPEAQKTDGRMMSRAVMLVDGPEMNNKPELEIFADDVACAHGATVSALEQNSLFYLMSRGIPRAEAETLLIASFVGEVFDTIEDAAIRAAFEARAAAWLAARKG